MEETPRIVIKVVAYITRESEQGTQLLVFRHPHSRASIQVPQGTVDEGEEVIDGLWRELLEETGRSDFALIRQIASEPFYADWLNQQQERNIFHLTAPADVPETWSYVVTDGASDKGLCFEFFWMPLAEAEKVLHWSQNRWLGLL